MQEETRESKSALPRFFTLEMFMFTVTALSGLVLLWSIAVPYRNVASWYAQAWCSRCP